VQLVSAGRAPDVAVDAAGDAVLVWEQGDGANVRIVTRTRGADGTLARKRALSTAGQNAQNPVVAFNEAGDAAVAWERYDGSSWRLQARTIAADGSLGPVRTLSPPGQDLSPPLQSQLAVDSVGNALVLWVPVGGGSPYRIKARALDAGGTLGPTQTVSPSGVSAYAPEVGFSSSGDALLAWSSNHGIQTRTRAAGGALGAVQSISPPGQPHAHGSKIIDVDPSGRAVFSWFTGISVDDVVTVETRTRTADGALGPVRKVSSPMINPVDGPAVGVDSRGDAVVAWEDYPRYGHFPIIRARTVARDGSMGAVRDLNRTFPRFSQRPAFQLALGSNGDAAVGWTARTGQWPSAAVQAAFGP
jgi:hypothetical protein